MANRIKRDSIFIVAKALTDSNAFKAGEVIGNYKDEAGRWIAKDATGKKWQNLAADLRNGSYFEFIDHYDIDDIIYYLFERRQDFQTVLWEMLVDAIKTTFEETTVCSLDDIYEYISHNLI